MSNDVLDDLLSGAEDDPDALLAEAFGKAEPRGAGETPPRVIEAQPIKASQDKESESGLDIAADVLPSAELKAFMKWTAAYRIGPDDPFYGNVIATKIAFSGAIEAGKAAEAVKASVDSIPKKIFDAAVRAGEDVRGTVEQGIRAQTIESGQALAIVIHKKGGEVAELIKKSANDFKVGFDSAVETKITEGTSIFAQAAARAAREAIRAASLSRFFWSATGVAALLAIATAIGAGGCWEFLNLDHRITPQEMAVSHSGKPLCGMMNNGKYFCELLPPQPPEAGIGLVGG